jgi:uncharacterized RDD family membrane protein YckC
MIAAGTIQPTDEVRRDSMRAWLRASTVSLIPATLEGTRSAGAAVGSPSGDSAPSARDSTIAPEADSSRGLPSGRVGFTPVRAPSGPANPHPADPTLRVGAVIVDMLILRVVTTFPLFAIQGFGGTAGGGLVEAIGVPALVCLYLGAILVPDWLYHAILESGFGQGTFGHRLLGITIADIEGQRISFGRASVRHVGRLISILLLGVPFLVALQPPKHRAFHDWFSGTVAQVE